MKFQIPDDESASLLEGIRTVAGNIHALAESARQGDAGPVDADEYAGHASYESLVILLTQAGLATPVDVFDAPSEELIRKTDPVLAPAGLTLAQIYEDAFTGAAYMLRQSWAGMKDAPEYPEEPRSDYELLHYCMAFLDLKAGSEELCAQLDTTPGVFARTDKSFALACAYESLRSNQRLVRLFREQQAQQIAAGPRGIGEIFTAARDFRQRYDEGAEQVFKDIAVFMRRSQIRQEEVKFYFLSRLQRDGDVVLYADPRTPLN